MDNKQKAIGPIVSASHLAEGGMPELSELEFALNGMVNAYHRWMERCANAAGIAGLTATDVLVLHHASHRGREKTLADLCLLMNVEDTYLVNYSIKKLAKSGLLETGRRGKAKTVRATKAGVAACKRYHEIREALLIDSIRSAGLAEGEVSGAARLLRVLSGQYDQAARSAASL